MAEPPSSEETALWQRRLAVQANNRAWRLSESSSRSSDEDEDMLQAAHAALHFWKIVGNAGNRAHAAMLVAHVYALLKLPIPAIHYWAQAEPFFMQPEREAWERACAHAVKSSVAAAVGHTEDHETHYREAERLIAALPDPEDREILYATLRVVSVPGAERLMQHEAALQVVDIWAKAFTESDVEAIVALYAADAVFLGTGTKELVTKAEDIRNYFRETFQSSRRFVASFIETSVIPISESAVVISAMDKLVVTVAGKSQELLGRVTFVVAKREADWKIVSFHRSAMPV